MEIAVLEGMDDAALRQLHAYNYQLCCDQIQGYLAEEDRIEGTALLFEHHHNPPDRVLDRIRVRSHGYLQAEEFIRLYLTGASIFGVWLSRLPSASPAAAS